MKAILPVVLLCFVVNSYSQKFTLDGVTNIEFEETDSDYSVAISDNFITYGVDVGPSSLTLDYTVADNTFVISGLVNTSFDGESIAANINFEIVDKVVTSLSFDVSTNFNL